MYEREAAKCGLRPAFVINLKQQWSFVGRFSELAPTLLTRTSMLWDMLADRLFILEELLVMLGIPMFVLGRLKQDRFSVELLALDGALKPDVMSFIAGNGMHLSSVGSVLLFALGMMTPCQVQQDVMGAASA